MALIMRKQQKLYQSGLKSIAKGGGLVLGGSFSRIVLTFLLNIIIMRYISQSEFGFFSICIVVVNIMALLSGLGFQRALPGYISCQIGMKEFSKAWSSTVASFRITFFLSICFALLLFLQADFISQLLHKPRLTETIKILALTLPLIALINLLVSHLRAVQEVRGRIFFQDTLRPFACIMLVLMVVFLGLSYTWVLWAYALGFLITFIALLFYTKRRIPEFIPTDKYSPVSKEIVLFSLPLLGSGIIGQIVTWTDTLFLGYFETAQAVGLYNGALRAAHLIPVILASAGFIYLPVVSRLYSENDLENIGKIYATVTKWVFVITLPIFLYMFLYPEFLLGLFFGSKYSGAGTVLQILSLGFFVHIICGPNAMTSISFGKTKINLLCLSIASVVNVILNIILIPMYGITGAAIASCFSIVLSNLLFTGFIYYVSRIHPFTKSYLKVLAFSIGAIIVLSVFLRTDYLRGNIFFLVFPLCISPLTVIITRSITEADVAIIKSIERKITKHTFFSDKLLRFIGVP